LSPKIEYIRSNALKKLVGTEQYADFEFIVDNHKIPAHKAILASRSEVFDKIFSAGDKKEEEEIAAIKDISKEAFKNFLTFIYSDSLMDVAKFADDYLRLSEKFGIAGMKGKITKVLTDKLTQETAHDAFQKAHRHNLGDKLKVDAFKMIKK
jgi:BTB/POZ domain-containing protein 9